MKRITDEQLQWIHDNLNNYRSCVELSEGWNERYPDCKKTGKQMATTLRNHHIKHGYHYRRTPTPQVWNEEKLQWLRDNVKGRSREEIVKLYNTTHSEQLSYNQIVGAMKRYKIGNGIKTQWTHTRRPKPVPKGTHLSPATEFKKGHPGTNTKEIGTISWRIDRSKTGYYWIKIEKRKWVLLHRYLWLQSGREIPKGSIVVFRDGNPRNCVIENLTLLTQAENAYINGHNLSKHPEEVMDTVKAIAAIKLKINTLY